MVYLELVERMDQAAEKVHVRLDRAANALNEHQVNYAIIGGNAVGAWLAYSREGAGMQTRDVDILLRRDDLIHAETALQSAGFVRRNLGKFTMFLDGPMARARDAIHVVFAGEKYREDSLLPAPDVNEYEDINGVKILAFESLIQMKLSAFRLKDQAHLVEFMSEGLIDSSMIERIPDILKDRFNIILHEYESTRQEWE